MTRPGMTRERQAEQRDKLRTMFEAGWSDKSIGKALGLKPKGVEGLRLRAGLVRGKGNYPHETKVDAEYLEREFHETINAPQKAGDLEEVRRQVTRIASAAQVDVMTVRRRLQGMGLLEKNLTRARKNPEQWERARELLEDGLPYAEVGREVGIASSTLAQRMPGMGVRPEDQGTFLAAKRLERALGL